MLYNNNFFNLAALFAKRKERKRRCDRRTFDSPVTLFSILLPHSVHTDKGRRVLLPHPYTLNVPPGGDARISRSRDFVGKYIQALFSTPLTEYSIAEKYLLMCEWVSDMAKWVGERKMSHYYAQMEKNGGRAICSDSCGAVSLFIWSILLTRNVLYEQKMFKLT